MNRLMVGIRDVMYRNTMEDYDKCLLKFCEKCKEVGTSAIKKTGEVISSTPNKIAQSRVGKYLENTPAAAAVVGGIATVAIMHGIPTAISAVTGCEYEDANFYFACTVATLGSTAAYLTAPNKTQNS